MKKLVSFFLIISVIVTLVSCNEGYEPVPSTEEEARVVMTLTFDGEIYEIRYELYRAFFLTYKSEIDGGNESVWSGADAAGYIDKINKRIVASASQIFAALHEAKRIGFDPYSNAVEDEIREYVRVSVEGNGMYGDVSVEGEESYENYLAALKEMNLNYSVQTLLIRYSLASAALQEYYLGDENDIFEEGGEFEYDEDDIRNYYFGNDCASIMQIFLPSYAYTATRAKEIRDSIASCSTKKAVADTMISNSNVGEEIRVGSVVGRYELDRAFLGELSDVIFALSEGETSEPIKVGSGNDAGYYITYRFSPNVDYLTNYTDLVEESYKLNALGKTLAEAEGALVSSVVKAEGYSEIIHSAISMD